MMADILFHLTIVLGFILIMLYIW